MSCLTNDCMRTWCKVMNIILGVLVAALGVLRFIFDDEDDDKFLSYILSIYFIIFGIIIFLTELEWKFITEHTFSFQRSHIGRGLFLFFVGILFFDRTEYGSFIGVIGLVTGILCLVFGAINIIFGFSDDRDNFSNPPGTTNVNYEGPKKQVEISNKL